MIRSGLVKYHDALAPLMVDIDSVQQHPENYNNGAVEDIAVSIETNGMFRPLEVQRSTGYILAGNHTWEACKTLGADVIPVVYLDVDDHRARRIMLADNRLASLAMPDRAAEVALLEQIKEHDSEIGLQGLGYTEHDLEVLRHLAEMESTYDEFATWPQFSVRLHPRILAAFRRMTREADTDSDRFEVLLRLAGWDGK